MTKSEQITRLECYNAALYTILKQVERERDIAIQKLEALGGRMKSITLVDSTLCIGE